MCCLDAGCGVIRLRGVSDSTDRARPHWRRHSARTEMFFADVRFFDVGTSQVCGRAASSGCVTSTLSYKARAVGKCSRRTFNLGGGYCHGSGCEWCDTGYIGMLSGVQKELVWQNGGDVGRRGDSVRISETGGGIICYNKEAVEVLLRRMLWRGCIDKSCVGGV